MKNDMKRVVYFLRKVFQMTIVLLMLLMLVAAGVYQAGRDIIDRRTVSDFDLQSFMGRWYEIARFDHSFERGLSDVTADYALGEDGMVEVINTGMRGGVERRAVGRAKTTKQTGQLRVSFFWIFYSDYNILEMGEQGEWALVGSRSPQYLWILSRTPSLPKDTLDQIMQRAERRGYNTEKLIIDNGD